MPRSLSVGVWLLIEVGQLCGMLIVLIAVFTVITVIKPLHFIIAVR